jgi:hypothetical protein
MLEGKYIHKENFVPKTALSSQKAALQKSNVKRYDRSSVSSQEAALQESISRGMVESSDSSDFTSTCICTFSPC